MAEENQSQGTTQKVWVGRTARIGGIILGILAGRYAGVHFFIPLVGAFVIWFLLRRVLKEGNELRVGSISVLGGHAIWLSLAIISSPANMPLLLEAAFAVSLLTTMTITSSKKAMIALLIYQIFSIMINVATMIDASVGSTESRALFSHIVFRGSGTILLIVLLWQMRAPPVAANSSRAG